MHGSIFDKRFHVIAGKGGVGKSTVAAAMAIAAARRGKKVLVAELAAKEKVPGLLGYEGTVGYKVTEVYPGVETINVTPAEALHEYGLIKLRFERLYRAVFENPIMRSLTRMIPGMNELVLVGKCWHLEQEIDRATGRPRWDLILVDSPATGHGVHLLVLPHVITETVKAGPMYDETRVIRDLLLDPARTCMSIVTLPEEMPVNETLELRAQMDNALRMQPGYLFVNGIWPDPLPTADLAVLERYYDAAGGQDPARDGVLGTARFMLRRSRIQQAHITRLGHACDMPQIPIPYQFTERFGVEAIESISARVEAEIDRYEARAA